MSPSILASLRQLKLGANQIKLGANGLKADRGDFRGLLLGLGSRQSHVLPAATAPTARSDSHAQQPRSAWRGAAARGGRAILDRWLGLRRVLRRAARCWRWLLRRRLVNEGSKDVVGAIQSSDTAATAHRAERRGSDGYTKRSGEVPRHPRASGLHGLRRRIVHSSQRGCRSRFVDKVSVRKQYVQASLTDCLRFYSWKIVKPACKQQAGMRCGGGYACPTARYNPMDQYYCERVHCLAARETCCSASSGPRSLKNPEEQCLTAGHDIVIVCCNRCLRRRERHRHHAQQGPRHMGTA